MNAIHLRDEMADSDCLLPHGYQSVEKSFFVIEMSHGDLRGRSLVTLTFQAEIFSTMISAAT